MPLLILSLASFVAWFISMLAGGGSPLVLIPLVNFFFGAQAVAPVITTGMLIGNAQRTLFFWEDIDWQVVLWYLPGALVGSVLGAVTFTQIHLEWLQILIGILLLLIVLNALLNKRAAAFQVKLWHFLPLALLNAFASGLIGSTGPIINPAYLNYGLVKERMIATKALNVVVMHVVKLATYALFGALTSSNLTYGLVIGLAAIPANWLGKLALQNVSPDQFKQLVLAFVGLSGLLMLWQQRQFFMP